LEEGLSFALGDLLHKEVGLNVAAFNNQRFAVDEALLDIEVAAFADLAASAHVVINDVLVRLVLKGEDSQAV